MDLSSKTANVSVTSQMLHNLPSANISVGGAQVHVYPGSLVTPAEAAALQQVLTSGRQSLILNASGAATSGTLNLSPFGSAFSTLVIPSQVKTLDSSIHPLSISNVLSTSGLLIGMPGGARFTIMAGDVLVNTGGEITTFGSHTRPLDLSIVSGADINNLGRITSSGRLFLDAAGSLTNGAGGLLYSQKSMYLVDGSGLFTNAGTIQSTLGNIAFNTATPTDLTLNNAGGQITAMVGNIDFRTSLFHGADDLAINGGTLTGEQINLFTGAGTVNTNVDAFNGQVNVYAGASHVWSNSSLTLGTVKLTGDPSFIVSAGSLTLNSNQIFHQQNLALVASGNITAGKNLKTIDLSSTTTNGGNLIIAAGFLNSVSGSTDSNNQLTSGSTDTLTGTSAGGGNIVLPGVAIKTSSTAPGGNGGMVQLEAAGGFLGGGNVTVGSINTSSASGGGGGVLIQAPGAISIGTSASAAAIKTSGKTGGDLVIVGQQPGWTSAPSFDSNGNMSNAFDNPTNAAGSSISIQGSIATTGSAGSGGVVFMNVGQQIVDKGPITTSTNSSNFGDTAGSVTFNSKSGAVSITGPITATGVKPLGSGGALAIDAAGPIDVNGAVDTHGGMQGGNVLVGNNAGAFDRITFHKSIDTSATSSAGGAGNVTILSQGGTPTAAVEVFNGIKTSGGAHSGAVDLESGSSNVNVGFNSITKNVLPLTKYGGGIDASSKAGMSANITILAAGDALVAGSIKDTEAISNTPTINITANRVRIDGSTDVSVAKGGGFTGSIIINANVNVAAPFFGIETGALSANGNQGAIHLTANKGTIFIRGPVSSTGLDASSAGGSIQFGSGYRTEVDGNITAQSLGNGGAISIFTGFLNPVGQGQATIKGSVKADAFGGSGIGGDMSVFGQDGVTVTGSMTATGTVQGGQAAALSLNGPVNVAGSMNASGDSSKTGNGGAGGVAGGAGTAFNVGGGINVSGGKGGGTTGSPGNGGAGGTAQIINEKDIATNLNIGPIVIKGAVDARGGNATIAGGSGGAGGTVTLTANTVRVLGTSAGGASINASGGKNTLGISGSAGTLNIQTNSLQEVPANFDLTSHKLSEVALPGDYFQVGNGSVNGTAGEVITAPNFFLKNTSVVMNTSNQFSNSLIIATGISSYAIHVGTNFGFAVTPQSGIGSNAPRMMLTPGEAIATYQRSRSQAQTLVLANDGSIAASLGNPTIIEGYEFNRPLTGFNIPNITNLDIKIDLPGSHTSAFIDLHNVTAPTVNGLIEFYDSTGGSNEREPTLYIGNQKLTVGSTGQINDINPSFTRMDIMGSSNASLALNGTMRMGDMIMQANGGTINISMGNLSSIHGLNPGVPIFSLENGTGTKFAGTINIQNAGLSTSAVTVMALALDAYAGKFIEGTKGTSPGQYFGPGLVSGGGFVNIEAPQGITLEAPSHVIGGGGTLASAGSIVIGGGGGVGFRGETVDAGGSLSIFSGSVFFLGSSNSFTSGKDMTIEASGPSASFQDDNTTSMVQTFVSGGNLLIGAANSNIQFLDTNVYSSAKDMHWFTTGSIDVTGTATSGGVITVGSLPSLSVSNQGGTNVSGNWTANGNISLDCQNGSGIIFSGSAVTPKAISMISNNVSTLTGSNSSLQAGTGITLEAQGVGGIALFGSDSLLCKENVTLQTTGSGNITIIGSSGILAGHALPGTTRAGDPILAGNVVTKGAVTIDSMGYINMGTVTMQSVGADLRVVARGGDLSLGDGSVFNAAGGNLSLLASGNIHGGNATSSAPGNTFDAEALVSGTTAKGGGIQMKAGSPVSDIATQVAFNSKSPFLISILGGIDYGFNPNLNSSSQKFGQLFFSSTGITAAHTDSNMTNAVVFNGSNSLAVVNPIIFVQTTNGATITLDSVNFSSITVGDRKTIDSDEVIVDTDEDEAMPVLVVER